MALPNYDPQDHSLDGIEVQFFSNLSPSGGPAAPLGIIATAAVPEPATLTLLGTALLGLAVAYLRRRRAKA